MNDTSVVLRNDTDLVEVVGDEIFSFVRGMSLANREAVKFSHQFCAQAATAEHNPITDGEAWFHFYLQVMGDCGWTTTNFTYSKDTASSQGLKLEALVVKAIAAGAAFVATGGTVAAALPVVAGNAIAALATSKEATTLFKRDAAKQKGTALNVVSCGEYANGEVVMSVAALQNSATPGHDVSLLGFQWHNSSSATYTGSGALNLNRTLYDKIKDVVEGRLGDNARKTLLSLKLKR